MSAEQNAMEHWMHVAPLLTSPTSEADYDRLTRALDEVLDRVGDDEGHPLASLAARIGDAITAYDEQHRPMPASTGVEALRYLMGEHGLAQGDLADIGTQSVVSELLSGRRRLNLRQIVALADRFGLPESVFIDRDGHGPSTTRETPATGVKSAARSRKATGRRVPARQRKSA